MFISLYIIIVLFFVITIAGWIIMGREAILVGFFASFGIATLFYLVGKNTFLESEIMGQIESIGYMFNLVYGLAVFVWMD